MKIDIDRVLTRFNEHPTQAGPHTRAVVLGLRALVDEMNAEAAKTEPWYMPVVEEAVTRRGYSGFTVLEDDSVMLYGGGGPFEFPSLEIMLRLVMAHSLQVAYLDTLRKTG